MSHFTLGVIVNRLDDVERVMNKYIIDNENYFERLPYCSRDRYISNFRQFRDNIETLTDEEIWQIAIKEYGQENVDDNTIYYYTNPNGRLDYYSIGGRWANSLKVKSSVEDCTGCDTERDPDKKPKYKLVDGAKIKDIQWRKMSLPKKQEIIDKTDFWKHYVELKDGTRNDYYTPDYYLSKYGTLENYLAKSSLYLTHALLDGIEDEWYEMGDVGFFGTENTTQDSLEDYSKIFYDLIEREDNQDKYFVLVDCHI